MTDCEKISCTAAGTSDFVASIQELSTNANHTYKQKHYPNASTVAPLHEAKITSLIEKHIENICQTCVRKAKKGRRECHINFNKDEFALANVSHELMMYMMLEHLTSTDAKLQGIRWDIFRNDAFTVRFSW